MSLMLAVNGSCDSSEMRAVVAAREWLVVSFGSKCCSVQFCMQAHRGMKVSWCCAWEYLDGDTQGALDGARGLTEDSQMGWAPAPSHCATPPMEQSQLHMVLLCNCCQLLLQFEQH